MITPVEQSLIPHPMQVEAWRRMTPMARLRLVDQSRLLASQILAAGIRHQHPDLGDDEVKARVQKRLIRG